MRRMLVAMCVLAGLTGLVGAGLVQAAPITADKAVTRLNQEVQVQMKVRSSKLRTDRDEVDLNSHTNFRDPANLAVVIDGRVAAWYSYQGIHDLPKFGTLRLSKPGNVFGHQPCARVGRQHFFMLIQKTPIQRGERAGFFACFLGRVVFATGAVIAHALDVGTRCNIGLTGKAPAICKQGHASYVR